MNPSFTYILLAIPLGLALFGLLQLIAWAIEPVFGPAASLRRLSRRRERRLARGEDRYFEELRAIDAAIEHNIRRASEPKYEWLRWPLVALFPFVILMTGLIALDLAGPRLGVGEAPAWLRLLPPLGIGLTALISLIHTRSADPDERRQASIFACVGLGVAALMLALRFPDLLSS